MAYIGDCPCKHDPTTGKILAVHPDCDAHWPFARSIMAQLEEESHHRAPRQKYIERDVPWSKESFLIGILVGLLIARAAWLVWHG